VTLVQVVSGLNRLHLDPPEQLALVPHTQHRPSASQDNFKATRQDQERSEASVTNADSAYGEKLVADQKLHEKRQPAQDDEEDVQLKLNHVQFEHKLKLVQMGLTDSATDLLPVEKDGKYL
jgi:hypothetical protein